MWFFPLAPGPVYGQSLACPFQLARYMGPASAPNDVSFHSQVQLGNNNSRGM